MRAKGGEFFEPKSSLGWRGVDGNSPNGFGNNSKYWNVIVARTRKMSATVSYKM